MCTHGGGDDEGRRVARVRARAQSEGRTKPLLQGSVTWPACKTEIPGTDARACRDDRLIRPITNNAASTPLIRAPLPPTALLLLHFLPVMHSGQVWQYLSTGTAVRGQGHELQFVGKPNRVRGLYRPLIRLRLALCAPGRPGERRRCRD
jgi:hypothetical protein